jgi:integrase
VELRGLVAAGRDPQAEKKAAKQSHIQQQAEEERKESLILRIFLDDHYYPFADQTQKAPHRTRQIIDYNFSFLMDRPMDEVMPLEIERWRSNERKRGIKPSTLNRALTAIKAVFNKAVAWKFMPVNPITEVKRMKVEGRGVVRYLHKPERKRLDKVLATKTGHLPVIVKLLLNTGARPNEMFTLKWENVNLSGKQITIQAAYTKTSTTRHIPLNSIAMATLKEWHEESKGVYVFPSGDAHITTVQNDWSNLLDDANIEGFRLYDCRHDFASRLVMSGVSIYEVAELLGHSSVDMTRVYAHLAPEHLQAAVERLS